MDLVLTKTTYKMKEQDLREKLRPHMHSIDVIGGIARTDNDLWDKSTDKCVQIAIDYAREEAIGFLEWKDKLYVEQKAGLFDLGNGIININELKNVTTSELYEIYLTTKTK